MISSLVSNNWVTVIILLMIGILVVLNFLYETQFSKLISLTLVNQYFVDYANKTSSLFNPFNLLLFLFQISAYALLLLKTNELLTLNIEKNLFFSFLKTALLLIIIYIIRYSVGRIIAVIVQMEKEQNLLTFIKMSHLSKISIFVFPAIIILYYLPSNSNLLSKIIIILTIVILLFKYLQILSQNQKLIFSNLFYFILYLCALEITPLIYFFKLFINKV